MRNILQSHFSSELFTQFQMVTKSEPELRLKIVSHFKETDVLGLWDSQV